MRIKDFSEEDRPRERLKAYGPKSLSNSELLALILRQGSKNNNVIDLANKLLSRYDLKSISRKSLAELENINGIGNVKASQIIACFELARRLSSFTKEKRKLINAPEDILKLFSPEMSTLQQEHIKAVYLDSRKRIISEQTIFVGSLNSSVIHPRELLASAITERAAGIIIIHNHPSGDPSPSDEDLEITKQLIGASNLLEIDFLDHIIIGDKKYFSFRESGLI